MGIDLRGGDAGMPEHFLYSPEISTAFHEVCGKRVTEGVWRNGLFYAGFQRQIFDDIEDHDPGQFTSFFIQE